jgi:predicted small lipoprotein YifL
MASMVMIAMQQTEVADAVHHERLLAGCGRRRLVLPEADQQVGGQTHALPPDEQHQVVVGQHQDQHRRDEQVQVGEEAATTIVVSHVADRVDVDQRADAR